MSNLKRKSLPEPTTREEISSRDTMRVLKKILERRDLSAEQKEALIQRQLGLDIVGAKS